MCVCMCVTQNNTFVYKSFFVPAEISINFDKVGKNLRSLIFQINSEPSVLGQRCVKSVME